MRMPISASASGTPTAQPTMTGTLDFFSEDGDGEWLLVEDAAGWRTVVMTRVETPAVPEDTEV